MGDDEPSLEMTVAEIAARWPGAKAALAASGLDLCCGGVHALRTAALAHGKDPEAVLALVKRAAKEGRR